MIKISKIQQQVHKFADRKSLKPVLQTVYTNGKKVVATDAHKLVEITNENAESCAPFLIFADDIKSLKIPQDEFVQVKSDTGLLSGDFPEYERIFPTDTHCVEIVINGEYLAQIASCLAKLDPFERITMRVSTKETYVPIVFTAKGKDHTARALLMPCMK